MTQATPPELQDLIGFTDAFNNESGRGAALVAISMIDERLLAILRAFMVDGPKTGELLSGPYAPLSTVSARLLAAYTLGLIDDNEYQEITTIRKIRNEFAHQWKDVTFDSQRIKDLCLNLPWRGPNEFEHEATPRLRFNFAVFLLLTDLLWRVLLVSNEKRETKSWPQSLRS